MRIHLLSNLSKVKTADGPTSTFVYTLKLVATDTSGLSFEQKPHFYQTEELTSRFIGLSKDGVLTLDNRNSDISNGIPIRWSYGDLWGRTVITMDELEAGETLVFNDGCDEGYN